MKRNNIILCLICLVAMISFSHVALGQSVTFTKTRIETNAKTSDGKSALKIHYDAKVKGCYGHTIKIGLTITTGNGTYIVDSEEKKGVGFTTQEIHYDNSNLNDRSITVPYSKFKVNSGKNTYYYQLYAVDKVTGDYLGESDLIGFDMVGKSNSSNNSSNKNTTTSKRSASFSDLRVTGSRNNEGGFTFYYDVTLKQCSGRKVKVQLTFKDSKGNYLYGKNNKKLIWSQTFDVKSDNIKYTDQSFTLTINQLNIPSDGKNFCYQFAAYDDKTGDLLGKSENKEKHLGNALVISDERLTLDEYEDGKPVITYYFHLDYLLPEAHDLKLVCALETNQNGKRHHRADGREMIQEYVWKNKEKSVYGGLDGHMGFDHDEINPLPGKNTYWIHIYVYDANTGDLLAKSKAFAFQAEDEGKTR